LIVVLDYGINNISSVTKAVRYLGHECCVQSDLSGATKLILPGVGAFGKAMERLQPLVDDIRGFASGGNKILGICLGQQLLFESSQEFGSHEGLGIVPGHVEYFRGNGDFKVPHVGWSPVKFEKHALLGRNIEPNERFYFVHSLYTVCGLPSDIAASTEYGVRFASAVEHENIFGTQFHPEKSGEAGLRVLRNFLEC